MHPLLRHALVLSALFAALLAALLPLAAAQTNPSATPNNSYGGTPFVPPVTWTPVTTYSSAVAPQPTVLSGVGPSITPGPASFSYDIPSATVLGLVPTAVYASLASAGMPTDAAGPIQPGYDPNRLVRISPTSDSDHPVRSTDFITSDYQSQCGHAWLNARIPDSPGSNFGYCGSVAGLGQKWPRCWSGAPDNLFTLSR